MRKIYIFTVCLAIDMINVLYSQTKVNNKFGNGIINVLAKDSSYSAKFAARMQNLYIGEFNINDSLGITNANSQFLVRRARIKIDGFAYSPKLIYKIELGLTSRDLAIVSPETRNTPGIVYDMVLKWNFYGNFSLWVGQTKLPGNRERVVSSSSLQFVDRSLVNAYFNIDRDMGFQLHHHFTIGNKFLIRDIWSVSQGEGRNVAVDNLGGYDWTARIELLPFGAFTKKGDYIEGDVYREQTPKLSVGATYDWHDRAVKTQGNLGKYMYNDAGYFETNIATIFVDMIFKYKGFSILSEYADKRAEKPLALNTDGSPTGQYVLAGRGIVGQMGYLFKNNIEIAARYTEVHFDSRINRKPEYEYTLGLSKYIVNHKLKVQSDVSYREIPGKDPGVRYRLQMELHL